MNSVAVGVWGAYFGTVCVLLGAALLAFRRSAQRLALTAFAAAMSGLVTPVCLGPDAAAGGRDDPAAGP